MPGITSLGVGSGLDLQSLVTQLVASRKAPQAYQITRKQVDTQSKISALGSLKSAVSSLQDAVKAMQDTEAGFKATSSDSDVVDIKLEEGGSPVATSYRVKVHNIATAQTLASDTFASKDAALGTGTLTLSVGGESEQIALTADHNSLTDVRNLLNDSDLGVEASIVHDGDSYRLMLTASKPGVDHEVTLSTSGSIDTRLDSAQLTETVVAQDASFSLNGVELTASGNTLDNVISGVTLTLKKPTDGTDTVELTISDDHSAVQDQLEAVADKYNAVMEKIDNLSHYDQESGAAGPLLGDSTLQAVQTRLYGLFSREIPTDGEGNGLDRLIQIGLHTDGDGKAELDTDRLDEVMQSNGAGVDALVSAFGDQVGKLLDALSGTDGMISARTDGLNAQLDRLGHQNDALNDRMDQYEKRLRRKFAAMDTMVAQFKSTSQFLAAKFF